MATIKFLEHFPGHHIFISMKEDSSKAPIHYHDDYSDKLADRLKTINDGGEHGIFFTVNLLDESKDKGRHRTKKMVTHARAVFMDADDPVEFPLDDFPLSPSLVVNTSPGKYHYYWLIDGMTDDLVTWNLVQRGLIVKYNGDDNAKDMTRYLRLPGYNHNKASPYPVIWQGDGHKYSWGELLQAFPPSTESKPVKESKGNIAELSEHQTIEQLDEIIGTAAHGLHGAVNKRLLGMRRDGYRMEDAVALMRMIGERVPEGERDERWETRFRHKELVRCFEDPDEEEIKLPDLTEKHRDPKSPPWPPGLMGKLAGSAKECARYQYDEVAIITAIGLIAGICGRKFNFTDKGLNIYMALIMDTGMGKDSISKFIRRALNDANDIGTGVSFIGPSRFTAPPGVYQALDNARSFCSVFTEAGLMFNSKAGDQTGLQRVFLSYCNLSGKDSYTGGEAYSDASKNIKPLRAVAPTFISESTARPLLKAFGDTNALEGGLIPRHLILRVNSRKPYPSRDYFKKEIDTDCMEKLKHLISKCAPVQNTDDPMVWMLEADNIVQYDMDVTDDHYVDVSNDCKSTDKARSIMASRAFNTMTTLASIASVFNNDDPVIRKPEWDWAKAMIEFMMDGLGHFFEGSTGDPIGDVVMKICIPQIIKILRDDISFKGGLSKRDHKLGKFKQYEFTQSVRKMDDVTDLGALSGFKNLSGAQVALEYMERNDMLMRKTVGKATVYTVTDTFIATAGD